MQGGRDWTDIVVAVAAGIFGGFTFAAISHTSLYSRSDFATWLPAIAGIAAAVGVFATGAVMVRTMIDNRRSSERQLRAYVGVASAHLNFDDNHCFVVMRFINRGLTPAYDVQLRGNWRFMEAESADYAIDSRWASFPDLGPTSAITQRNTIDIEEFRSRAPYFADNRAEFHVFGELRYDDAFRVPRTLRYHFAMRPEKFLQTSEMNCMPDGNWSD